MGWYGGGTRPQNSGKNVFSGNYHVKSWHFSGKYHIKIWNFVNFSGKYRKNSGIWKIFLDITSNSGILLIFHT